MKKFISLSIMAAAATAIVSCSKENDRTFVGFWESVNPKYTEQYTISISKDKDDSHYVVDYHGANDERLGFKAIGGSLRGDAMYGDIFYITSSQHLRFIKDEYVKLFDDPFLLQHFADNSPKWYTARGTKEEYYVIVSDNHTAETSNRYHILLHYRDIHSAALNFECDGYLISNKIKGSYRLKHSDRLIKPQDVKITIVDRQHLIISRAQVIDTLQKQEN